MDKPKNKLKKRAIKTPGRSSLSTLTGPILPAHKKTITGKRSRSSSKKAGKETNSFSSGGRGLDTSDDGFVVPAGGLGVSGEG
jgi:hypothetical protein